MATDILNSAEALRDLESAIARLTIGRRAEAAMQKARECMDQMREEMRKRAGTLDLAVSMVREVRDT